MARIWRTIMNGDMPMLEYYGYCKYCGKYVHESHPHELDEDEDEVICADCSFINGLWTEQEYLRDACFAFSHLVSRACVRDGKIYLTNKLFPWEKTPKQQRREPAYVDWRNKVFERDDYTCVICGQRGGDLNAHHIRPFKKFPKLRTDLDNGITLCEKCHRKVHKEKDPRWLKDSY